MVTSWDAAGNSTWLRMNYLSNRTINKLTDRMKKWRTRTWERTESSGPRRAPCWKSWNVVTPTRSALDLDLRLAPCFSPSWQWSHKQNIHNIMAIRLQIELHLTYGSAAMDAQLGASAAVAIDRSRGGGCRCRQLGNGGHIGCCCWDVPSSCAAGRRLEVGGDDGEQQDGQGEAAVAWTTHVGSPVLPRSFSTTLNSQAAARTLLTSRPAPLFIGGRINM